MNKEIIAKAYSIIGDLTPLATDCGALCDKACCAADEDGQGGVYLFPGEEELIAGADWCDIINDPEEIAPMAVCTSPCTRDMRPLACRIFPLTPVFSKGVWTVRMDVRARAMCPLARSGVKGLRREFAVAVRDAIRLIAADPEGELFLQKWQALEDMFRNFSL